MASAKAPEKSALGLLGSYYGDDDDDEGEEETTGGASSSSAIVVQAAPSVLDAAPKGHELAVLDMPKEDKKGQSVMYHNAGYETEVDELWLCPGMTLDDPRCREIFHNGELTVACAF